MPRASPKRQQAYELVTGIGKAKAKQSTRADRRKNKKTKVAAPEYGASDGAGDGEEAENAEEAVAAPEYSAGDGILLFGAFDRKLQDAVDGIDIQKEITAELNDATVVVKLAPAPIRNTVCRTSRSRGTEENQT